MYGKEKITLEEVESALHSEGFMEKVQKETTSQGEALVTRGRSYKERL